MAPGPDWSKAFPEIGLNVNHEMILASKQQRYSLQRTLDKGVPHWKKRHLRKHSTFSIPGHNEYVSTPHLQFLLQFSDFEESSPKNETNILKRRKKRLMQSLHGINQPWNTILQDSCDISPSFFKPTELVFFCSMKLKPSYYKTVPKHISQV